MPQCAGEGAHDRFDIFKFINVGSDKQDNLEAVLSKFRALCKPRRNIIYDTHTRTSPAGGQCHPNFRFCPPDFFLAPHGIFLGERSWCFWAEKTLKFAISARKSVRMSAKTFFLIFFFFISGDHLLLVGKFVISARKSLRISGKTFAALILILPPLPPISRSWRRPCTHIFFR